MQGRTISQRVIECAFEVSNALGAGFLEKVYENALCVSLEQAGIHFVKQKVFDVHFRQRIVGTYVADIVVEDKLLIELKALSGFNKDHEAQVMNYLKASGLKVGLLINFGTPKIGIKRIVRQYDENHPI